MRAIVYQRYGQPEDVLELRNVGRPVPSDGEVLVRVRASSINSWDWDLVRGKPLVNRIGGMRAPKYSILGADIAGTVEAVGTGVTAFQPGDDVFGDISGSGWGGFAEYVCPRAEVLASKPASLGFEEAAVVPQAGVLALQALRAQGGTSAGQRVLFNGAGGGVGTLGIQIARHFGAESVGVDRGEKLATILEAGAVEAIDYTQEDFAQRDERYDRILDVAAYRSMFAIRRVLAPGGAYMVIGGSMARIIETATLGSVLSLTGSRKYRVLLHRPNADDLAFLGELLEAGAVVPVIGERYSLDDVPEAVRALGAGEVQGKLVVSV